MTPIDSAMAARAGVPRWQPNRRAREHGAVAKMMASRWPRRPRWSPSRFETKHYSKCPI